MVPGACVISWHISHPCVQNSSPSAARFPVLLPDELVSQEIVDLLEAYRAEGSLRVEKMGRGYAWLDTGTHGSLLDAGNFVRTLTERQGLQVGCPDEIAYRLGWIGRAELAKRAEIFRKNDYGRYLAGIVNE